MRKSYGEKVQELKPNEVFVFGSNLAGGFHGAGAAGFASFGVSGNRWREFGYAEKPNGWKGKWNIKGQAEGLQTGVEGTSYALPTVWKAGMKRSLTSEEIAANIKRMYKVAEDHPLRSFLVAGSDDGKEPLNGYSHTEMCSMYAEVGPIPPNVIFSDSYSQLIFKEEVATVHHSKPDGYKSFSNKECPYYPCHDTPDVNCLFCFCVLYHLKDCGGDWTLTDKGLKDCSKCALPHGKDGWDRVMERLKEESDKA